MNTRRSGLALFAGALALGLVLAAAAHAFGLHASKGLALALAVPFAAALAGLSQAVTGVRFTELASRWESLQGWQRGVLGLLIVLAAGAVFFALAVLFVVAEGP